MDWTISKAVSFEKQKADEYRYWQSVSPDEKSAAAWEMILSACHAKGLYEHGQELDPSFVSLRPARSTSNSSGDETQ